MATYPYFTGVIDTTVAANATPLGTGQRPDQQLKSKLVLTNGLGVVATAPTPLTVTAPASNTRTGVVGPYTYSA